jgi:hypothetical protein
LRGLGEQNLPAAARSRAAESGSLAGEARLRVSLHCTDQHERECQFVHGGPLCIDSPRLFLLVSYRQRSHRKLRR